MRIGNVELTHNAVKNCFDFKINPQNEEEPALKTSIDVQRFIQDFILKDNEEELNQEQETGEANKFFQKYQLEKDPYNPELSIELEVFLSENNLVPVEKGHPAFSMGLTLEWDVEKKKVVKNIQKN